jgi:hypothetical protein
MARPLIAVAHFGTASVPFDQTKGSIANEVDLRLSLPAIGRPSGSQIMSSSPFVAGPSGFLKLKPRLGLNPLDDCHRFHGSLSSSEGGRGGFAMIAKHDGLFSFDTNVFDSRHGISEEQESFLLSALARRRTRIVFQIECLEECLLGLESQKPGAPEKVRRQIQRLQEGATIEESRNLLIQCSSMIFERIQPATDRPVDF